MPRHHRASDSPHIALITTSGGPIGGMETFTRALIGWLRKDGWCVTLGLSGHESFFSPDAGVEIQTLDWVNPSDLSGDRRYRWRAVVSRYRWFQQTRPDVALFVQSSNTPFRAAVLGARLAGIPVVMTQRTMPARIADVPSRRHFFGLLPGIGLHRKRLIWSSRLAARLANRIVYNSRAVRMMYEHDYGYPVPRGVVIANATTTSMLIPDEFSNTSPSVLTLGYRGRLGREKRIDVLLHALASLRDLPLRLDIYGDGPECAALEELTRQLSLMERVAFHRSTIQGNEAYEQFDMVVLCSPRESSSNMILEAMAAGCTTIVTRVGGLPELVGGAGVCVDPLNVPQLAGVIRELATDELRRRQLGHMARQRATAHHAPQHISRQWTTLLRSVATHSATQRPTADTTDAGRIDILLPETPP